MRARQIFAGIGCCLALNVFLIIVGSGGGAGDIFRVLTLPLNLAAIVVPAVRGHKGFAVGFALGYVVAFVLFLGACFLALASFNKMYG